jgi:hypothetical protein
MIILCLSVRNVFHGTLVLSHVLFRLKIRVFFFIEEKIDNRMIKENTTTAIISIVQGVVGEKQIEHEFMNMFGKNVWRWFARQISENKFLMRFPNPKMINDLGYFH